MLAADATALHAGFSETLLLAELWRASRPGHAAPPAAPGPVLAALTQRMATVRQEHVHRVSDVSRTVGHLDGTRLETALGGLEDQLSPEAGPVARDLLDAHGGEVRVAVRRWAEVQESGLPRELNRYLELYAKALQGDLTAELLPLTHEALLAEGQVVVAVAVGCALAWTPPAAHVARAMTDHALQARRRALGARAP